MANNREETRKLVDSGNIKDLRKVVEYLKFNPMANMIQVHESTGVPISRINDLVRHGILKIRSRSIG